MFGKINVVKKSVGAVESGSKSCCLTLVIGLGVAVLLVWKLRSNSVVNKHECSKNFLPTGLDENSEQFPSVHQINGNITSNQKNSINYSEQISSNNSN